MECPNWFFKDWLKKNTLQLAGMRPLMALCLIFKEVFVLDGVDVEQQQCMSDQRVLLWWLWWNFQKESLDWGCYINNVTIVQYFVTGTLRLFMFDLFISSHYNNF